MFRTVDEFTRRWVVTQEEYPSQSYPPCCRGAFYFISTSLTSKIARNCPYHCTLQTNRNVKSQNCFWKFEDVFLGSCLSSISPKPASVNVQNVFWLSDETEKPASLYESTAVIHPLKSVSDILTHHAKYQSISRKRLKEKIDRHMKNLVSKISLKKSLKKHQKD